MSIPREIIEDFLAQYPALKDHVNPSNSYDDTIWETIGIEEREDLMIEWLGPDRYMRDLARYIRRTSPKLPKIKIKKPARKRRVEDDSIERTFAYDPETGQITRIGVSLPVVGVDAKGYGYVTYGGRMVASARLAWYLTYGRWPAKSVKHVNGVKTDDRLVNLSVGVVKRYQAQATVDGTRISLGYFETRDERDAATLNHKLGLTPRTVTL